MTPALRDLNVESVEGRWIEAKSYGAGSGQNSVNPVKDQRAVEIRQAGRSLRGEGERARAVSWSRNLSKWRMKS